MTEKTFILGLGASKSGTTWIQTYLNGAAGVDMGRLGEYQIWDALHLPANSRYRIPRPGPWKRAEAAAARWLGLPIKATMLRFAFQQDTGLYFDYFERLLNQPGIRVTGDITPGYAGLSRDLLGQIDRTFAARGITVRPVFVMRDPIERAWSALKMRRRKGRLAPGTDNPDAFVENFREAVRGGFGVPYATTLRTIDAVFAAERAHLALFETMFTPSEVQRLSKLAGIPADPGASRRRVNDSGDRSGVSPDLARQVFADFAPDYDYCLARFPEARATWPHAHLAG